MNAAIRALSFAVWVGAGAGAAEAMAGVGAGDGTENGSADGAAA
jgi:hypothetical protein